MVLMLILERLTQKISGAITSAAWACHPYSIELADQVREDDCAVAGHSCIGQRGHCAKRQLLPPDDRLQAENDGRTSALTISGASRIRPGRRAWSEAARVVIGRAKADTECGAPLIGSGAIAWVVGTFKAPERCGFPPAAEQQTDSKRSDSRLGNNVVCN